MSFNNCSKNTFIFLFFILLSSQAFGMDWLLGCCRRKKIEQQESKITSSTQEKKCIKTEHNTLKKTITYYYSDGTSEMGPDEEGCTEALELADILLSSYKPPLAIRIWAKCQEERYGKKSES